jgi:hypothetical protein
MNRDQIGSIICPEVSQPNKTVNRIMNRLRRDGYINVVPQMRHESYVYMPNPSIIHPRSEKLQHYLGLVDIYIRLDKPSLENWKVEPQVTKEYRPDAALRSGNQIILIEYQRTPISTKRMQEKVDNFHKTYDLHKSKTLWVFSHKEYNVTIPQGFTVRFFTD